MTVPVRPSEQPSSDAASGDGERPVVVFTDETVCSQAVELLRESCEVRVLSAYPPEAALIAACTDAQAILARLGVVTGRVIEAAPRLRIIARHGVGVDAVDVAEATRRGILVTTTGSMNAAAVAEYTLGLLLALARKIPRADQGMRTGGWDRQPLIGLELDGLTMGVVGLGAIGSRVARYGLGLGMSVVAHDPHVAQPSDPAIRMASFADLLREADVVTLHTRLTPETHHMIDDPALEAMKPGALLLNTARGELVDQAALTRALARGGIGGAALDAFEDEPLAEDSPLRGFANVVLSPHVAGQTAAALVRVGMEAAAAILDELAGRVPRHVYNPEALEVRRARTL